MPPPGREKSPHHHELAQALDLASREEGLSTSDVATALHCSDRTIRRYFNGERRPDRDLVVRWERLCHVEPGRLAALHDRAAAVPREAGQPRDAPPPQSAVPVAGGRSAPPPTTSQRRRRTLPVVVGVATSLALAALALTLVLRPSHGSDGTGTVREQPWASSVRHHFTPSYTGTVWLRITPTRARSGEARRVRLQWGEWATTFSVAGAGSRSRTFVFQKKGADDVALLVQANPAARLDFGEGEPRQEAQAIASKWEVTSAG